MDPMIEKLLLSDEPSIRYRITTGILNLPADSIEVINLQQEVRNSARVKAMLAPRDSDGVFPWYPYQKWKGAFWTFLMLADLGYPKSDPDLVPLREQMMEWMFDKRRLKSVPLIDGRWRRCACQEGGVIFSLLRLGLADERVGQLAEMLLKWQWPDGGWNCDVKPDARHSSFNETFIPLRAMNEFWLASGDARFKTARDRAAELLLSHSLYKRIATGEIIKPAFLELAYPACWHYNYLNGLQVLSECGMLSDARCVDALNLLESRRLPDGGFAVDVKYYQVSPERKTRTTFVDWGGVSRTQMNPFLTAEALVVLHQSGRLKKAGK